MTLYQYMTEEFNIIVKEMLKNRLSDIVFVIFAIIISFIVIIQVNNYEKYKIVKFHQSNSITYTSESGEMHELDINHIKSIITTNGYTYTTNK
jgi:cell division protein FtsI/penicillin-binding protein 2